MLFTAIVPIEANEWVNGAVSAAAVVTLLDVSSIDNSGGVARVIGNLTQFPPPVTPVVSSESSPV